MLNLRSRAVGRLSLCLVGILSIYAMSVRPGNCDPGNQLHEPTQLPIARASAPISQDGDILLIMPAASAQQDQIQTILQEVHGTIIGTIGEGPLTVYKVQCEKGKMLETQKKLSKDKNFSIVECNYKFRINAASPPLANDPYFPNEWHLGAVNAIKAWQLNKDKTFAVGILDTGVSTSNQDLSGKVYQGYDAIDRLERQDDVMGHGTYVATTFGAKANNGLGTAGVARNGYIYPVRVGTAQGYVDEAAILDAIYRCGKLGIKVINISANADPPYSFANPWVHPAMHTYLKWFHDARGGLVFNASGNNGARDTSARLPYLIVVSAIGTDYSLASFSTYGNPVWFTAPGVGIYCSGKDGRVAALSGTSFSTPICAGIAAMVWGANQGLSNTQVEQILIQTCYKAGSSSWTQWYGFGMPNAEAAVKKATGQ